MHDGTHHGARGTGEMRFRTLSRHAYEDQRVASNDRRLFTVSLWQIILLPRLQEIPELMQVCGFNAAGIIISEPQRLIRDGRHRNTRKRWTLMLVIEAVVVGDQETVREIIACQYWLQMGECKYISAESAK